MKLFLLGVFGTFTLLVLFFNFGTDFKNRGASAAATTPQPTSGPFPTVDTVSRDIYYKLNMAIESMEMSTKFTMLEHLYGASYQVVDVGLQPENGVPTTLQIDVRCECARNAECCSSLHTFVVMIQAMDYAYHNNQPLPPIAIPDTVSTMEVSTFNHTDPQGTMTVPWPDVVKFLQMDPQGQNLDGFSLWYEVTPVP